MRVFVLNTGRCGSTTFIRACEHLVNYSAAHESLAHAVGDERFSYPDNHVEADNRLSWFLGELGQRYGDDPLYVHLRRDPEAVARSFALRWDDSFGASVIRAFAHGIVMRERVWPEEERLAVCRFYVRTVTSNIEAFLASKPNTMRVSLEDAPEWFPNFWERIGGSGDRAAAVAEFGTLHNASKTVPDATSPQW